MRRASQKHPPPAPTRRAAPSTQLARPGTTQGGRESFAAGEFSDRAEPAVAKDSRPHLDASEIVLSPAGTFVGDRHQDESPRVNRQRQLAIAIRQRIESRLAGRIRNLAVRIIGQTIILEGQCSTYYSKQLAQHAALGVIQDEQLENAIVVAVPR